MKQNNKGTWYVFDVSEAGSTDPKDAAVAEQLYQAFAQRDLNFEVESEQTPTSSNANEEF